MQEAFSDRGCRRRQTLRVDLDHDARPDCLVWTRCGPDAPLERADGGLAYPADRVVLTASQGGRAWELYSNADLLESERLEEVTPLRLGPSDERVLLPATSYGTGNIQIWAVTDLFRGAPRRWTEPPLDAALAPLLAPGERIGKHFERGVHVRSGGLELAWLVYRSGDPNCCPAGGLLKVRLVAGTNEWQVERAWREREP